MEKDGVGPIVPQMKSSILLTGAAGIVGTALRPVLRQQYNHIVLADLQAAPSPGKNESVAVCDICNLQQLTELTQRVDGIVHLAGLVGAEYSFEEVLQPNIRGTHNVFQAAHSANVTNVVYASSHHAIGFVPRGSKIDDQTSHRPDSPYGLSKAFGESAASFFADNFGLNILSIRIGFVGAQVGDERRLHTWISPRDLAQLIQIGLNTPDLGHEIVYGTSNNPRPFFDNSNATRLGYRPQDRSTDHLSDPKILEVKPNPETIAGGCVGGGFAAVGFEGETRKILPPLEDER